jgi:hypothetical protein
MADWRRGLDLTHLGGIVALIGSIAAAVGTVVGSKISISLLRSAHERFEDSVWESIRDERKEREAISVRLSKVEGICEATRIKGGCP